MTDPVPADNSADDVASNSIPAPTGKTKDFVPERTHVFALTMMALVCVIMAGWAPLLLGWTVLVPAIWIYWVMRAKTTVGEEGIAIRYAFRGSKTISWDEFEGVGFKGSKSFASTTSGQQFNLPGVTFNSLPGLYDASRGRIPDALSEGKAAADEKVVVVHRDGQQMIMSKEEYEQYKAANDAAEGIPNKTWGNPGAIPRNGQSSSPHGTPPKAPRTQIRGRDGVE